MYTSWMNEKMHWMHTWVSFSHAHEHSHKNTNIPLNGLMVKKVPNPLDLQISGWLAEEGVVWRGSKVERAKETGRRYQWEDSPAVICSRPPAAHQIHTCMGHTSYSAGRARSVRDTSLGRSDLMRWREEEEASEFRKESEKKDQLNPMKLRGSIKSNTIIRLNSKIMAIVCAVCLYNKDCHIC